VTGPSVRAYTEAEMNAAIERVESAKQDHPRGWAFLETFGLQPADTYVTYAFLNASAHVERLGREEDRSLIYAAGWMNGLAVGAALEKGTERASQLLSQALAYNPIQRHLIRQAYAALSGLPEE
jgi:hypothetical protein